MAALHRQTGGNPFFLDEVVRLLVAEGRLTEGGGVAARLGVPIRIHDTIERRLAPLSPACRELLELASVIGLECGLGQLAGVAQAPPAALLGQLDEARAAGIVTAGSGPGGRLRFRHALFREALYDALGDARRVALHAEVGRMLERQAEAPAAELAHHFLEATEGAADVERAVEHARRAAADATARLAYEDAARLYERAIQALDLARITRRHPARRAARRPGRSPPAHRGRRGGAARRSRTRSRSRAGSIPPAAARCSRGPCSASPGAGAEVGRADLAVVHLLDEALAALDPADGALRVRLLARLAAELAYAARTPARHTLSEQAVAMAERLGDPGSAGLRAGTPSRRADGAGQRRRSPRAGVGHHRARPAHRGPGARRRGTRLAPVRPPRARATWRASSRTSTPSASSPRRPGIRTTSGWPRCSAPCAHYWRRGSRMRSISRPRPWRWASGTPIPNALVAYGSQLYVLRWGQGRLDEIEPLLRDFAAQHGSQPVWESARAHHAGAWSDVSTRRARASSRRATRSWRCPATSRGCRISGCSARRAPWCGIAPGRRCSVPCSEPFAGQQLVAGPGAACFGAAARVVALLAATLERWDEALAQLDRADALNERLGALAWVAQTTADRAAVLARA